MQAVVDGLLTQYTQIGEGDTTALLLHGWGDSSKTFDALRQQLSKDNLRTIALDLPGFGATQAPNEAWGLPEYASFVASFIQKIKLRPTIIIGHSNGGAIAIYGLSNNIFTADKLVLLGSAGIRYASFKKTALQFASKPAKVAISVLPKSKQRAVKAKMYGSIGSDYLVAEQLQETFKKVVSYDVQSDAEKITIPTLLIYGEKDTATPPSYGERFKDIIPNSELTVMPGSTHFVHQEKAAEIATKIGTLL